MAAGVPAILVRSMSRMQRMMLLLERLDPRYEADIEGGGKCVWTDDGHRIELETIPGGGFIAARSKAPDDLYPGRVA